MSEYWVATDAHIPGCLPTGDGAVTVHTTVVSAWQHLADMADSGMCDCMAADVPGDRYACSACADHTALVDRVSSGTPGRVHEDAAEGLEIYTVESLDVDRDALIDAATETVLWSQCRELSDSPDDDLWPVDMSTTSRPPVGVVRERMRRADRDDVRAAVAEWVDEWVSAVDVEDLRTAVRKRGVARIGHSLVLSAAGYAAGFWDEGLGDVGTRLCVEAQRVIGNVTVWVSPRGRGGWRRLEGIDR